MYYKAKTLDSISSTTIEFILNIFTKRLFIIERQWEQQEGPPAVNYRAKYCKMPYKITQCPWKQSLK